MLQCGPTKTAAIKARILLRGVASQPAAPFCVIHAPLLHARWITIQHPPGKQPL
jgi:hypothetical protein